MKKYKIVIQNAAKRDSAESKRWYNEQRKGLGKLFIADIKNTLSNISDNPFSYAFRYAENRKANLKKFPFGIFFFIDNDTDVVYVIAIKHNARNL
jgi:toxin ParE1/3/4